MSVVRIISKFKFVFVQPMTIGGLNRSFLFARQLTIWYRKSISNGANAWVNSRSKHPSRQICWWGSILFPDNQNRDSLWGLNLIPFSNDCRGCFVFCHLSSSSSREWFTPNFQSTKRPLFVSVCSTRVRTFASWTSVWKTVEWLSQNSNSVQLTHLLRSESYHTTILNHFRDELGMKHFYLRWIPHQLTERIFDESDQLLDSITSLLEEVQPSQLQVLFTHWRHTVRWIFNKNRDDYHQ
jgi:hypothetical protein